MTVIDSEIDASFYNLVHQLTGSPRPDECAERRKQPRRAYKSVQRIAPRRGPNLPEESEFFDVPCQDLTRSGFSFLMPAAPDFAALVAAFGNPPNTLCVGAEVSHCEDVLVYPSGAVQPVKGRAAHVTYREPGGELGEPMVLVGCRFTERLER